MGKYWFDINRGGSYLWQAVENFPKRQPEMGEYHRIEILFFQPTMFDMFDVWRVSEDKGGGPMFSPSILGKRF